MNRGCALPHREKFAKCVGLQLKCNVVVIVLLLRFCNTITIYVTCVYVTALTISA